MVIFIIIQYFSLFKGIADLVFVKKFLENGISDFDNLMNLGIELGLFHSTLEKIRLAGLDMLEDCTTRMLAAWLKRVDNVHSTSWSTLKTALNNIGKPALAATIPTDGELYCIRYSVCAHFVIVN